MYNAQKQKQLASKTKQNSCVEEKGNTRTNTEEKKTDNLFLGGRQDHPQRERQQEESVIRGDCGARRVSENSNMVHVHAREIGEREKETREREIERE